MATRRKPTMPASAECGYDGRRQIYEVTVDDPYEAGTKAKARVNVRHDVLVHWRARKQIDDAQYAAGLKLQKIWYKARIGMPGSVQYGRDKVDVSGSGTSVAERFMEASKELAGINSHLGMTDYGLLCRVICEGSRLEHEAQPVGGREPERYIARRIKDALGYLAEYWGATGRSHASIRADRTDAATRCL